MCVFYGSFYRQSLSKKKLTLNVIFTVYIISLKQDALLEDVLCHGHTKVVVSSFVPECHRFPSTPTLVDSKH